MLNFFKTGYEYAKSGISTGYEYTKYGIGTGYEYAKSGISTGYEYTKYGIGTGYEYAKSGISMHIKGNLDHWTAQTNGNYGNAASWLLHKGDLALSYGALTLLSFVAPPIATVVAVAGVTTSLSQLSLTLSCKYAQEYMDNKIGPSICEFSNHFDSSSQSGVRDFWQSLSEGELPSLDSTAWILLDSTINSSIFNVVTSLPTSIVGIAATAKIQHDYYHTFNDNSPESLQSDLSDEYILDVNTDASGL